MRKTAVILGLVLGLISVMAWTGPSMACEGCSSGYHQPVEVDWLNFTATLTEAGEVEMHWTPYNDTSDFMFYKVVRSTTNPDPVYPDDGYIFYSSNINTDSYTDHKPPTGTVYYRVCVITSNKDRWVSHVVTIENNPGSIQNIHVTLNYREDVNAVDIRWTKYTGDDFVAYKVYHAAETDGSGGIHEGSVATKCVGEREYELIATIDNQESTIFSDYNTFVTGMNFYKVVVVLEGNKKIESNEASINVPSQGEGGGETPQKLVLRLKSAPKGIVDCCNCSISFSWEAMGGSGDYRYQYRLTGYDNNSWSDWSNATSVTYQGLPQGSYTFIVICDDTTENQIAMTQKTFTIRCNESGNGTIPTADISLSEHDIFGNRAVDLNITTKAGTDRNIVDIYFGLVYPTGHFRCLVLGESGITLGDEDALQPLFKNVEMFDIDDPITLYTYVIPDDAPTGEYLWVVLFTDSKKSFFNPDWIISYDMESFSVQ